MMLWKWAPVAKDNKKYGVKPSLALLPLKLLWGAVKVLMHGRDKYGAWNYMEAESTEEAAQEYVSACLRHLSDMLGPGKLGSIDDDSGLMAVDHALVNLIIAKHHITKLYGEGTSKYAAMTLEEADELLIKEAEEKSKPLQKAAKDIAYVPAPATQPTLPSLIWPSDTWYPGVPLPVGSVISSTQESCSCEECLTTSITASALGIDGEKGRM